MKHTTRREPYNPRRADVLADENINVLHSREEFLSNSNNKHQLIKLLAKHFRGDCHTVIEYEGDDIRRLSPLHLMFPAKNKM